ncbi:hypothetical protein QAD02_005268 [Eretmocerus hayati]|uniref:Uncharacterized protein n=1 Tax=Eretmocerus hayati TaxID=131215 RepID=A0ACC2NTS1_9HYME|nr:hypothetical protein QAD02_005268 [Eretmocerus hayati]
MSLLHEDTLLGVENQYPKNNWSWNRPHGIRYLAVLFITVILLNFLFIKKQTDVDRVIRLKHNQTLLHTLSDKFLSFGLDSSLLRDMKNFPLLNDKFINLAHHLSPAYVRFGGTSADCLYFNQTASDREENRIAKPFSYNENDISNFTITRNDFLALYVFSERAKVRMIFDLNVLLRNGDGSWNSDNAHQIITYARGREMDLDWQMGNEPNSFFHVFDIRISAEQLAKDYCQLRKILNQLGYQDSFLVGPEANHIGDEDHKGAVYAENFLKNVENCVDGVTWHQYYLNGHVAQVDDFVNYKVFNRLSSEIDAMNSAIKSSGKNLPMWISETGSAYGGGAPNLSNRFAATFLWLDKLGYSAKAGVNVVIRQSFFGGNYAMIGEDLNPNPDWWVAVLFKKFVSEKVLNFATQNNFGKLRFYAHCSSKQALNDTGASIVIYGLSLNEDDKIIQIQGPPRGSKILYYSLASEKLQSRNIWMNGDVLRLQKDGTLPRFKPKVLNVDEPVPIPGYSLVFLLIRGMKIPECS